jgi:hypothetical protein
LSLSHLPIAAMAAVKMEFGSVFAFSMSILHRFVFYLWL